MIFSALTPDRMPAAAGLSNFARITAGAVGTSIFTTAWENRAIPHHAELAESVPARRMALKRRRGAAIRPGEARLAPGIRCLVAPAAQPAYRGVSCSRADAIAGPPRGSRGPNRFFWSPS